MYINNKKKKIKTCPITGQPVVKSWGLGEGVPPLTNDPENPIKPFAEYEEDDKEY